MSSVSTVAPQMKTQVIAPPGRQFCAKTTDNCFSKGCCAVEGYTCFETKAEGEAKCMKSCDKKKYKCTQSQPLIDKVLEEAVPVQGQSLYCFAVVAKDTGSPKPNYDQELIDYQSEHGVGIFNCEETGLYSDAAISLSNGRPYYQVFDEEGDWKFAKRKTTGAYVNTGLFTQVWKAIKKEGKWEAHDWVVKADPDAVFVVPRLKKALESTYDVPSGSYFANCPYVDYGFFGNLEVISKTAWSTLLEKIDVCKADKEIDWKVGIKKGKYGPMGEDLFAQVCMDKYGVKRVGAYDLTQDGACEAKRDEGEKKNKKFQPHCDAVYGASLHPFKKVDAWAKRDEGEKKNKKFQPHCDAV